MKTRNYLSGYRLTLLLVALLGITVPVMAYDFEIDGIYYYFNNSSNDMSVTVTYKSRNSYSGDVTIPASVTYSGKTYTVTGIGYTAFYESSNLTSVTIPNTITFIGESAFGRCTSLTSVTIPNSVITISKDAFEECTGLTSIKIPKSVTYVGTGVFRYCYRLSNIEVENGNPVYDSRNNCKAIIETSTNTLIAGCYNTFIPESVTSIGTYAFYGCRNLTSIFIPSSVTVIGDNAFYGCSNLATIEFPNTITKIGTDSFEETAWLNNQPDGLIYIGLLAYNYKGSMPVGTSITLKEGTIGIVGGAFESCKGLTSITIPESVLYIGDYAFYGCNGLVSINIPNSVTSIGRVSFCGCTGLTSAAIGNSVTEIGKYAFEHCSSLSSITIPNSVAEIGDYAFSGCNGLMRVDINDITSWCKIDFGGSTANPVNYAHHLFLNGIEVTNLVIPSTITKIKNCAFCSCYGLRNVIIPNSVTEIGQYAFRGCNDLLTISIPESVVSIDYDAFDNTAWYNTQSDGLVYLGLVAYKYKGTMPAGTSIVLKEGTKGIAAGAFNSDGLTGVTIPKSVVFIGSYALASMNLRNIKCFNVTPPLYQSGFNDMIYPTAVLSVPVGGLIAYLKDYPWNRFYNIIEDSNNTSHSADYNDLVGPTSWMPDYSSFNGRAYIITDNEEVKYYLTGLDPESDNMVKAIYENDGGKTYSVKSFTTPALSMTAKAADMITNKDARLMAETNMADVETSCGFEWRRYDAPEEMPSAKVYCPVYGGVMAGTLKNMSENVYYKYRPFYKSSVGNEYYGDWIAFITADAGVEFEPVVYTYNSPAVTQTDATLQGVALRGSEEITEQGFEYWKAGRTTTLSASNNVTRVTARGERMTKTVTGLQAGTRYKFRAYVTAGGETTYGAEVEFVTLSSSLDVNLDGEVNIADVNAVIDLIMDSGDGRTGDVNGDGEVNIADINAIIDAILSK